MRAWACKIGGKRGAVSLDCGDTLVLELQGSGRKKNSPSQNGGCAGERKRDDRLENGRRGKNDGPFPCRDARKKTNSLIFCHSITAEIRIQVEVFCRIRAPPAPFPSTPF